MDQEIETLESQVAALIVNVHRLAEEKRRLLDELTEARAANAELRERIAEARSRVSLALERLPGEGQFIGGPSTAADTEPSRSPVDQAAVAA